MTAFSLHIPDSSDAEIDALQAVCERLNGFDDRISVEWLDGYLTALAAGPLKADLKARLETLADGAFHRAYGDPQDAEPAEAAIAQRLAVLQRQLDMDAISGDPDTLRLAPLMLEFTEEERAELAANPEISADDLAFATRTGAIWSLGFLEAIDDAEGTPEAWPDFAGPEHSGSMAAELFNNSLRSISVLAEDDEARQREADELFDGQMPSDDDWVSEALFSVQDLRLLWLQNPVKAAQRIGGPKVGRNDPCPCGSGQKYKKCHGANA